MTMDRHTLTSLEKKRECLKALRDRSALPT